MKIKEVYIFASDSRAGRLLELNPGEKADITPLFSWAEYFNDSAYLRRSVVPHLRQLSSEDVPVVVVQGAGILSSLAENILDHFGTLQPEDSAIVLPAFSARGGDVQSPHRRVIGADVIDLNNRHPHLCIANASNVHQEGLFENKVALDVLAKAAGAANLPKTGNYLHPRLGRGDIPSVIRKVRADFAGSETVVFKSPDSAQGRGILVTPYNNIEPVLTSLLMRDGGTERGHSNMFSRDGWSNQSMTVFQVQECVPGTLVKHQGQNWSATTRILWSVAIGQDENGMEAISVTPHGGFYKLPCSPMTGNKITQDNTVSYSSANTLRQMLARATGKGAKIVIENDDELMHEAEPLRRDLVKIFGYIDPMNLPGWIQNLRSSGDPVQLQLAKNIAEKNRHSLDDPSSRWRGRIPVPGNFHGRPAVQTAEDVPGAVPA